MIQKSGDAFSMIVVDTKTDVVIESLTLIGNHEGTDTPDSAGIYFNQCSRITVRNCYFQQFGNNDNSPPVGAAIYCANSSEYIQIDGNIVTDGEGEVGEASDIMLYSNSGYAVISNNMCLSRNSQGIYTNTGASPKGRVAIVANICRNHTRHGIVAAYTSDAEPPFDTIVANNVVVDNGQTGIYLNSPADSEEGGPF